MVELKNAFSLTIISEGREEKQRCLHQVTDYVLHDLFKFED